MRVGTATQNVRIVTAAAPLDVVLATGNVHKLAEMRTLLAGLPLRLLSPADLPPAQRFSGAEETGSTFRANADLKAIHAAKSSGLHALADDSGLEVDALDGRPGVISARYAGEGAGDLANNRKLVAEARAAGLVRPAARFRCELVLVRPDGTVLARGSGACDGVLIEEPRGRGGFGYDPHFLVPELERTFAELLPSEKNAVSHRARAAAELRRNLASVLG
jgi:XTP/dITP diphosphohydrolase